MANACASLEPDLAAATARGTTEKVTIAPGDGR
jgi:hypothetical protein